MLPTSMRTSHTVWTVDMEFEELIPNPLSCVLFEDKETKRWVGHCLDFDLATSGRDEDTAWLNLKAIVRTHVEHCFTNWQEGLMRRKAPEEFFAVLAALKEVQTEYRSDKISFTLVPPKMDSVPSLWMHGFEGGSLSEFAESGALQAIN